MNNRDKFEWPHMTLAFTHLYLESNQMGVNTTSLCREFTRKLTENNQQVFLLRVKKRKYVNWEISIYGLKQSSSQQYLKFYKIMMSFYFAMTDEDQHIYVKNSNGNFLILCLYVKYILLDGNNLKYVKTFKSWLSKLFVMIYTGEEHYILDSKIQRDCSKKFLSLYQQTNITKILEHFLMILAYPCIILK